MKTIDVQDELAEGFDPSPLPPIGRDGGLALPPLRKIVDPPPRICDVGPCAHYHQFETQLDVASPLAHKGPDGHLTASAQPFHIKTHHYCYPSPGIELALEALPVLRCNRWDPVAVPGVVTSVHRADLQAEYTTILDAWIAARRKETELEDDQRARAAAELAQMPAVRSGVNLTVAVDGYGCVPVFAMWGDTAAHVGWLGLAQVAGAALDQNAFTVCDRKGVLPSPDNTIAQLGMTEGDLIILKQKAAP